jgi:hypothetical protein
LPDDHLHTSASMPETGVAQLTIAVSDHASSDAGFVALTAVVACRGFAGRTQFVSALRDLHLFVEEATDLAANVTSAALLLGGWDNSEQPLRLQLAHAGLSRAFSASIRIATNGPRSDQWNRVETEFVVAPERLTAFLSELHDLASEAANSATLMGDANAIA